MNLRLVAGKLNSHLEKQGKIPKAFLVNRIGLFVQGKTHSVDVIRDIICSAYFIRSNIGAIIIAAVSVDQVARTKAKTT